MAALASVPNGLGPRATSKGAEKRRHRTVVRSEGLDPALAALAWQVGILALHQAELRSTALQARAAGATWQQLGAVLGMTPKSAWKRYAA